MCFTVNIFHFKCSDNPLLAEFIVVQAKRSKDKVGIRTIQEENAAIPYYKANKAMVITNNYFTPNAKSLAYANPIQLIDRDKLSEIIRDIQ